MDVWKRSIEFADEIFGLADDLPQTYRFSLTDQLRRASLSIPTNIAEGSGRDGAKERAYFYKIAKGSVLRSGQSARHSRKKRPYYTRKYRFLYKEADEIASILSALINK